MKSIYLRSSGVLKEFFGKEPQKISLEDHASIDDLMQYINLKWGTSLPSYLWDPINCQFKGPIYLLLNNSIVKDFKTDLPEGSEVQLLIALTGGSSF